MAMTDAEFAELKRQMEELSAKLQTITFDEFYAKYKPLHTEHGDLWQFEPRTKNPKERAMIEQAIAENRLWTYHHGEYDSVYFHNGPHFVNRLDYVICEVPYADGEEIVAEDPDHQPHWYCEWCQTEYDVVTRERYDELCDGRPCGAEGCTGDPDYDPDDALNACTECGEPNDDGEGWDGMCGNCADKAEED